MLTFETTNNRPNLIIFVHGFTGGKETWIRTDGRKSILNYLKEDSFIADNYDFAVFDYFTKVTGVLTKVTGILALLTGNPSKISKNIPVEDIANELQSEIRYKCKRYDKIILIAHSMGGLISKAYILGEINANKPLPVRVFISLAVPHRGTNLAVYSKAILSNPQVKDLEPLSDKVNVLNDLWVDANDKLPKTMYCLGSYDEVVPKNSAVSSDAREKEIVFSQNDHTSIVTPETKDSVVLHAIIEKCTELLSNPNTPTTKLETQTVVSTPIEIRTPTHNQQTENKTENTPPLSKKDKDVLKNKLSDGKEKEVIETLHQLANGDNDLINKINIHKTKLKTIKDKSTMGTMSPDSANTEKLQTYLALFEIIDEFFD